MEAGVVNSGPLLINLGPFESRSNGEWTRVSVSFDYYFPESEWGVRNGYKYHFRFELRPPDSVNDPASGNNTTRTPVFDNY